MLRMEGRIERTNERTRLATEEEELIELGKQAGPSAAGKHGGRQKENRKTRVTERGQTDRKKKERRKSWAEPKREEGSRA
jgi:hypothetical protein